MLVAHDANESRPMYSPDGAKLAFISDRTGGGDIYVLTFATGALSRLTFDDGLDRLDGVVARRQLGLLLVDRAATSPG